MQSIINSSVTLSLINPLKGISWQKSFTLRNLKFRSAWIFLETKVRIERSQTASLNRDTSKAGKIIEYSKYQGHLISIVYRPTC